MEDINIKVNDDLQNIIPVAKNIYFDYEELPYNLQKLKEKNIFAISIDRGFGSTKSVSANGKHIFSSYVAVVKDKVLNLSDAKDILIKYDDVVYRVGDVNRSQIKNAFDDESINLIYSTDSLLNSIEYKVSNMAAIALALVDDPDDFLNPEPIEFNGESFFAAGLPVEDLTDKNIKKIKDVISGLGTFAIRTNKARDWKEIKIKFNKEDIYVNGQPTGTLQSLVRSIDGTYTEKVDELYSSEDGKVLILDGGYETWDTVVLNSGSIINGKTWTNCATENILKDTTKLICEELEDSKIRDAKAFTTIGLERKLQRYLRGDKFTYKEKNIPTVQIDNIEELIKKAIKKNAKTLIENIYDTYGEYDELRMIATGGTPKMMANEIENFCEENDMPLYWAEQKEYGEVFDFDVTFANSYGYFAQLMATIFDKKDWDLYENYNEEEIEEEDEEEEISTGVSTVEVKKESKSTKPKTKAKSE